MQNLPEILCFLIAIACSIDLKSVLAVHVQMRALSYTLRIQNNPKSPQYTYFKFDGCNYLGFLDQYRLPQYICNGKSNYYLQHNIDL